MARMIPDTLLEEDFDPASQEDKVFERLKNLPDDYVVFHSFRISSAKEREIDFVIFHKDKGLLCLESKAGQISCGNGRWYYGNNIPMKRRGPYEQARSAMWKLFEQLEQFQERFAMDSPLKKLSDHVMFQYGVCFPSISKTFFNLKIQPHLPQDADPERTLTDDELNPKTIKAAIDHIFDHPTDFIVSEQLDEQGANILFNEFLCPTFDIVPSPNVERADRERHFLKLLKEQARVLDFLVDQRSAAICGAAGTGKTLVALEKAKQEARNGDKVLFLCFNSFLRDHLEETCKKESFSGIIDVKTIAEYACSICRTGQPVYGRLISELETMFDNKTFPYNHVIVDEAQDFGSLGDHKAYDVLECIEMCIRQKENGTFFLFYDRLQMVQARQLPSVIEHADCKLTLYTNCRNTRNIAKTAISPLPDRTGTQRQPKTPTRSMEGTPPIVHFADTKEDAANHLAAIIQSISNDRTLDDVVILTCKTEETSSFANSIGTDHGQHVYRQGGKNFLFTTCRKFKGLEADAVILVDVDGATFLTDDELLFYVGASRAKFRLDIIASLSDDDVRAFLSKNNISTKHGRERMSFLNALNCTTI